MDALLPRFYVSVFGKKYVRELAGDQRNRPIHSSSRFKESWWVWIALRHGAGDGLAASSATRRKQGSGCGLLDGLANATSAFGSTSRAASVKEDGATSLRR